MTNLRAFAIAAMLVQAPAAPPPAPSVVQTLIDFAETLIAAPAEERQRLLAERPDLVNPALRYFIASRATRIAAAQQYGPAIQMYDIALEVARAAGDRAGESETLQVLGYSHYFLHEFDAAERAYRARLALAREMNDREAIAASTAGLATIAYSRADYSTALASYRDALAIYEALANDAAIGTTLVSVGNVAYLQADYDAAALAYRRAIALLTTTMDVGALALARSGLARVFASQGDLASALDVYGRVLADARARKLRGEVAGALESIGELHYRLRNIDQARAAFEEAAQLAEAAGAPADAGRLLGNLGLTELVAGQFDRALTAYTASRIRYEQARDGEGAARGLVGIGFSQAAREKFPEAMTAYTTAITAFEGMKRDEDAGRAWLGLSLAQSNAGESLAALESARRVRRVGGAVRSDDLQWRGAVREGEALRALKRPDEARRAFDTAIAIVQRLAADAPLSGELRASLLEADSAWRGLAFARADRGDAAAAFAAEEQRRAFLRRLTLDSAERDIVRGMTADEQQAEQQATRDVISARAQLHAERSLPRPNAARVMRLEQRLKAASTVRETRQSAVYARVPVVRTLRGLDPPPRLDQLAPLVRDPRTIAVEYSASDEEVLILLVSQGEHGIEVTSAIAPYKRREFAASLADALKPEALRDPDEWRERSAPLAALLIEPIAGHLVDRDRLVILPDDLLWKVPFEALANGDADVAAGACVSYATSFATWIREWAMPPAESRTVTALAGPELLEETRAQLALTLPGWALPDPALAVDDATTIAAMYGDRARVVSGADATETALRAAFDRADIVQAAAPMLVTGASPLFSCVLLSGPATPAAMNANGRWDVREWFGLEGRARFVVLTDATSLGAPGAGAAMDTLAWAAAAAGVRALAIARWPVDGFDTRAPLLALHEQLARDDRAPLLDAWRQAIVAGRAAGAGTPAAWAGIRVIGAP